MCDGDAASDQAKAPSVSKHETSIMACGRVEIHIALRASNRREVATMKEL